mmetsp:Transcript_8511/g.26466  ORF Transcript_8511/g.26466 Transcript_8511/m.26466 type:complete len:292 (-) Transcript_8511:429-1304(-)
MLRLDRPQRLRRILRHVPASQPLVLWPTVRPPKLQSPLPGPAGVAGQLQAGAVPGTRSGPTRNSPVSAGRAGRCRALRTVAGLTAGQRRAAVARRGQPLGEVATPAWVQRPQGSRRQRRSRSRGPPALVVPATWTSAARAAGARPRRGTRGQRTYCARSAAPHWKARQIQEPHLGVNGCGHEAARRCPPRTAALQTLCGSSGSASSGQLPCQRPPQVIAPVAPPPQKPWLAQAPSASALRAVVRRHPERCLDCRCTSPLRRLGLPRAASSWRQNAPSSWKPLTPSCAMVTA